MARVIGMDVHRDFAQVVVLDGDQLRHFGRVRLDKDSLTTFADRLMADDEVVLEATGNTFAIVRVLRHKVRRVAVANPLQVRLISSGDLGAGPGDRGFAPSIHPSKPAGSTQDATQE